MHSNCNKVYRESELDESIQCTNFIITPSLIFFPNRGNKLTIIFHGSMETKEKTSL